MNQLLLLFGVFIQPLGPAVRRERKQGDQRHHKQKHYNEKERATKYPHLIA